MKIIIIIIFIINLVNGQNILNNIPENYCNYICPSIKVSTSNVVCNIYKNNLDKSKMRFCYQGAENGKKYGCSHCCSTDIQEWHLNSIALKKSRVSNCRNSNPSNEKACESGFNVIVSEIIKELKMKLDFIKINGIPDFSAPLENIEQGEITNITPNNNLKDDTHLEEIKNSNIDIISNEETTIENTKGTTTIENVDVLQNTKSENVEMQQNIKLENVNDVLVTKGIKYICKFLNGNISAYTVDINHEQKLIQNNLKITENINNFETSQGFNIYNDIMYKNY